MKIPATDEINARDIVRNSIVFDKVVECHQESKSNFSNSDFESLFQSFIK